jgi:4-hydroxy-3-methylbut-2-enyl diphosphate reductase
MKVLRAAHVGFCAGVRAAIDRAKQVSQRSEKWYSLGPVIHNRQAVARLTDAGLEVVTHVDDVGPGPVLVGAHGVAPTTLARLQAGNEDVVDATCPLVQRAQNAVRKLHEAGYAVVVVGDANHPEVRGIVGYAPRVVVVGTPAELDRLPDATRLGLIAQTTLSQARFAAMVGHILTRPFQEVKVVNTLCGAVARRLDAAVDLCGKVDVMFVLGGLHSANTRVLAEVCANQGVPTYHLEDWTSFRHEYVEGRRTAGITAGASTPHWIIEEFAANLERVEVEEAIARS